jgi:hypothetical protein
VDAFTKHPKAKNPKQINCLGLKYGGMDVGGYSPPLLKSTQPGRLRTGCVRGHRYDSWLIFSNQPEE